MSISCHSLSISLWLKDDIAVKDIVRLELSEHEVCKLENRNLILYDTLVSFLTESQNILHLGTKVVSIIHVTVAEISLLLLKGGGGDYNCMVHFPYLLAFLYP